MHVMKNTDDMKKYLLRACKTHDPGEVILFHDQRDTMHRLLQEVARETGRELIDKDLSTMTPNEIGGLKLKECKRPAWINNALEGKCPSGYILYLREFHLTDVATQADVMNILIRKEVRGIQFPKNTLIVLGVRKEDEATEALTHTHVVKFYK